MTNNAAALVQDNFIVLPVSLLKFTGELQGKKVTLEWETGQADHFNRFAVERSVDGRNYATIGTRLANNQGRYSIEDDISLLSSQTLYYRLKMIDADGSFSHSRSVMLKTNALSQALTVYPNPGSSEAFVSFSSTSKATVLLRVVDLSGRVVMEQYKGVQTGNNVFFLDTRSFVAGWYSVQVIQGKELKISPVYILR